MRKFKVGDIIVPNKSADGAYKVANRNMKKGKVVLVCEAYKSIRVRILEHTDIEKIGREYIVDEGCFEKARKTNESIVICRKGNTVIAADKSTGKTARATCMESDTFNLADGQKLAFYRLMGTPEEKIREMLPHLFEKKETEKPFVIKQDRYNVGDKVLIVDKFTQECDVATSGSMDKWLGKVMTIKVVVNRGIYKMVEDEKEYCGGWFWNEHCIVGKVIEGAKKVKRQARAGEYVQVVEPMPDKECYQYNKGDIFKVFAVDIDGRAWVDYLHFLLKDEYVVLEGYRPEMLDEIKPGDTVKVIDAGQTYSRFAGWEHLGKYKQNFVPKSEPTTDEKYRVLLIEKLDGIFKKKLALIQNQKTTQVFIVNVTALRKVEE